MYDVYRLTDEPKEYPEVIIKLGTDFQDAKKVASQLNRAIKELARNEPVHTRGDKLDTLAQLRNLFLLAEERSANKYMDEQKCT